MTRPDPEGLGPVAPVDEVVAITDGDPSVVAGAAPVEGEPVVVDAADADRQAEEASAQVVQLERWRTEWRTALGANETAGPQLATGFRDSKYGGPKAEFIDPDGITPDVLMVRIMRKPNLWANIKQLRTRDGWRLGHLVETAKSFLPDGVDERVVRCGWIVSRREFVPDYDSVDAAADNAEEPEEAPAEDKDLFADTTSKPAESAAEDEDDAEEEEPDTLVEHIVVTNDGATLRFVGETDLKPRRGIFRRRDTGPYRYAGIRTRKGLDDDDKAKEEELLNRYVDRNSKRFTTTMKLAGAITIKNFEEPGKLGPEHDEITPDMVEDGLEDRIAQARARKPEADEA